MHRTFALLNDNLIEAGTIKSINPTLSQIIGENTKQAIATIVDSSGNGTYTTIKEAVESKASLITIKNGNYIIDEDLILENQYIIGESKNGVNITLDNASIIFKEIKKISSGGTAQFFDEDRTVDGDNTAFNKLDSDIDNKYIYTDGAIMEVDYIASNIILELKAMVQGLTNNPIDGTVVQEKQISFESNATCGGVENLTINHITTKARPTIVINGHQNKIKNIHFYNESQLSIFLTISKNNTQLATNTIIENNFFEGGANGIKINRAYNTIIENNYFNLYSEKAIEFFSHSDYTEIRKNTFASGLYGITGNTKNCSIMENKFAYIQYNAIKLNYESFTSEIDYNNITIFSNSFYNSNISSTYTTNGCIAIRGAGNIIAENTFDNCNTEITLNCSDTILCDTYVKDTESFDTCVFLAGNNNIIAGFVSDDKTINYGSSEKNIIDSVTGNDNTLDNIGSIGNFSILMNTIAQNDELLIDEDTILFNNFIQNTGICYVEKNSIAFDNDTIVGDWNFDNDNAILAFNQLLDSPPNAIDIPNNSIAKANLVDGINPPTTNTSINNVNILNYF